jgi:hypothetical protein
MGFSTAAYGQRRDCFEPARGVAHGRRAWKGDVVKLWRLPFVRRPDPALTLDEVMTIHDLCAERLVCIERDMSERKVSESVIRERRDIEGMLPKIREAMASMGWPV